MSEILINKFNFGRQFMFNFFFKTYGCQANVADSQALANYLNSLGGKRVEFEKFADLIVINTCAIRAKAEQKVFSYIGELAPLKKDKKHLKIGVIGCIASYRKKELRSRFDHVSFVFGAKEDPLDVQRDLTDIILKMQTTKNMYSNASTASLSLTENCGEEEAGDRKFSLGGIKDARSQFKQSFVNIMTGCNNYCSYCIVPFTRGREKSYSVNSILERVKSDVASGAQEIILLGQNVNSYKDVQNNFGFSQLLEKVARVEGNFWVRFVSPHPKDMTIDVLDIMAKYPEKLCAFLHFPLQSGSNKILEAMKRTYTREKYMEQIGWIREKLPQATITTDIIVGFPGETEDDYLQTRKVMEDVKFDNIFSFIYSSRKYTAAAMLPDDCPKEVKLDRLERLQKRHKIIAKEKNSLNIGKTLKCLVEKRLTNGTLLARTEGNVRVLLESNEDYIGQFVEARIESVGVANMTGSLKK